MAFLKISRDKRGYENYYLFDGKGRPRLLFWFRTPPQVKVGRAPFSDEVRTMVEAQNPGVLFDWPRIIATPVPPPDVEHWRERRRAEKAAKRAARAAEASEAAEAAAAAQSADVVQPVAAGAGVVDGEAGKPADVDAAAAGVEAESPAAASEVEQGNPAAPASGHRRRRRRRGRRGGGQGQPPPPETPPVNEV